MAEIFKISDDCINCGSCAPTCPETAIVEAGVKHTINEKCTSCGNCLGICPVDAISGVVVPS